MSRTILHAPSRPAQTTRPLILTAVVVLAILTLLSTAPAPDGSAEAAADQRLPMVSTSVAPGTGDEPTFAQLFAEMHEPELGGGEGQGTVVVAAEPADQPGVAQATQASPAVLPPVEAVLPTLRVSGLPTSDAASSGGAAGEPAAASPAALVSQVPGVTAAAEAWVGQLALEVPGGVQQVTVAAVDAESFRPLTPAVTANEAAVWQRLVAGDAVFNHDAGNRLAVPLGSEVAIEATPSTLRIGAYASNGIPPVADALVALDRARALGMQGVPTLYVGLAEDADVASVIAAINQSLPGASVEAIEPPAEQQAFLTGSAAAEFFEPFSYIDHGDGLITIDPDWVARNIQTRRLPIFTGNVTCHRQMLVQLEGALAEVEAAGLAPLIDTTDYGGCWVARHIDWRPDRPLSMHAWGLAVDFNVRTNGLGARPTMDPRIVAIFDRWGFVWGGRWSRPDGMHFELGAVLQTPPVNTIQPPQ